MPKHTPYARIAITLPAADLAAADRLAKQRDRSRSWIFAEAVRRYAAVEQGYIPDDIGSSRRAQLQRDLLLTPNERVRIAGETSRLSVKVSEPQTFETFDAFLAWHRENGTVI